MPIYYTTVGLRAIFNSWDVQNGTLAAPCLPERVSQNVKTSSCERHLADLGALYDPKQKVPLQRGRLPEPRAACVSGVVQMWDRLWIKVVQTNLNELFIIVYMLRV